MARSLRLAVAALSVAALSTIAGSALADAASAGAPFRGCSVQLGTQPLTLPANAPALLVGDQSQGAQSTVRAELVSTEGRTPLGAPAKDTHDLLVVTLPETAAVGAHTIASTVACSDKSPDRVQESPLVLTAPVDFPTTVGTLALAPNPAPRGTDKVVFTPSPALRAFEAITILDLSVNGARPGGGRVGGISTELHVNTGSVCVENGALHREQRTVHVSLAAHLAGVAASPAPASLDILVDCGAIRWTTDDDFDGASSANESSSGKVGTADDSGHGASTGSAGAGGCSAAPRGGSSGGSAAMAAMAVMVVVAGVRRRRAG